MNVLGFLNVVPRLPERIARLRDLAENLMWTWRPSTRKLFRELDPAVWESSNHDPLVVLREVQQERLEAAAADPDYLVRYDAAVAAFDSYLTNGRWYEELGAATTGDQRPLHAYFCAEYGWHESVELYSGGLGVLAGDHTKAASDLGVPLVAVGLFYPEGYFHQRVAADGKQQAVYTRTPPSDLPLAPVLDAEGRRLKVSVEAFGRTVWLQAWRALVGQVEAILLDVDHDDNAADERALLARLYGGDQRTRIAQEIILGIGGVRMLRALDLAPTSWHMNEGHSAFMALERCRELVDNGQEFNTAREVVAANTLFTVHTPIAAGNDAFAFDLIDQAFPGWHDLLGLTQSEFQDLGRADHGWGEVFSMPALAIRFSSGRNGVAELHGETSRRIWSSLWPGVPESEVPIGHVTNGVHLATWMAPEMQDLLTATVGEGWQDSSASDERWRAFEENVDAAALWTVRRTLKAQSVRFLRRRLERQLTRHEASPTALQESAAMFDAEALTIGFARRFAAYKRATLIFRDLERLEALLTNGERPVQLVFAGKAHPADQQGQALIEQIHRLSNDPRFHGRILFVEDYDMAIGRALTRGVDVWLNNPRRPLEASGTSGQKAAMNGVLNLSVLDGWWPEAFDGDNGWAIGTGRSYADEQRGDESDADSLYSLLEREVVPLYYRREPLPGAPTGEGLPRAWLKRTANAVATVTPVFNARRMVKEYVERYYLPASRRAAGVAAEDYAAARDLARWRERVAAQWPEVTLSDVRVEQRALQSDEPVLVEATVDTAGFSDAELTVELVYSSAEDALATGLQVVRLERQSGAAGAGAKDSAGVRFAAQFTPTMSGRLAYGLRCYPRHPGLASSADAHAVTWA